MSIFGTSYPMISGSAGQVLLEHSKVNYNFITPDVIEHVSVLTGWRCYPYSKHQSNFQIDLLLCNYSSSESSSLTKFNQVYSYKNQYFYFYPHSDWSASSDIYGDPIEYYMTQFSPYYLNNQNTYDGVIINISPRKNSVLTTVEQNGYGTAFGLDYDFTGW